MADQDNFRIALAIQKKISLGSGGHGIWILKIQRGRAAGWNRDRGCIARQNLPNAYQAAHLGFDDCGASVWVMGWIGTANVKLMIQKYHVIVAATMVRQRSKFDGPGLRFRHRIDDDQVWICVLVLQDIKLTVVWVQLEAIIVTENRIGVHLSTCLGVFKDVAALAVAAVR